jgi:drug/metabolite transporter (DMT)-like permease
VFVPHVTVPRRRRDGRQPTPRQRLAGVLAAVIGAGISAGIGAAHSKGSHHDTVVLLCIVVGLAFAVGLVVARVIGGRSKV